ncbi:MAG: polysaccharide export protein [bacterium]|nr:polysaccharide export protein [bacterium]
MTTQEQTLPVPPQIDTTFGVGDTFDVRVFGEADLSGSYKVGGQGNIDFPLIGIVRVQGLDPQGVAKLLADKLRQGILRDPQVTVLAKEQTSKKVYIMGQVGRPGTLPYTPSMNVVEAITLAGGFTPLAAKNDTVVTRVENGKKTIVKIPAGDIGEGRARNFFLLPGDIISVPERIF